MRKDFRHARDRVAADATRSGHPGAHRHILFSLVALMVVCALAAAVIIADFTPHELYRGSAPAPTAAPAR
jgi:hypothetical protein